MLVVPDQHSSLWLAVFVIILIIVGFAFLWMVVLRPSLQKTREDKKKHHGNLPI
jgi:heme/copper-type cytochrome/quinol oxidase subunit 2